MKDVAIVVGHNSDSQGAVRADTGESEWSFNTRLARFMADYTSANYPGMSLSTFFRDPSKGGYRAEIQDVYYRVDQARAVAAVELHFNSHGNPAAKGTETLVSGSPASLALGKSVNKHMHAALGIRDRGVITRRTGRGSGSLIAGNAPAILIEPFFGSSVEGQAATDTEAEQRVLASAIVDGIAEALGVAKSRETTRPSAMTAIVGAVAAAGVAAYAKACDIPFISWIAGCGG
jgi:N-acetylmuramoyl-L-alanine amidase